MASFKRISNTKLVWEILQNKARKRSLYNARILFKKYDDLSLSKTDIKHHMLDFDWKHGLWVDLVWAKYTNKQFIVRVLRDKKNSLHLFDKDSMIQFFKMYLLLLITKIKKLFIYISGFIFGDCGSSLLGRNIPG